MEARRTSNPAMLQPTAAGSRKRWTDAIEIAPVQTRHDTTTMTHALSDREENFTRGDKLGDPRYQPLVSLDPKGWIDGGITGPRGRVA